MWVKSLGGEDPLEEGTATHSGLLVENPRYRGAWQATVCRAAKSQTRLIQLNTHTHTVQKVQQDESRYEPCLCGNFPLVQWLGLVLSLPRARLPSLVRELRSFKQHATAAKSLQSCLTLCNPIDGSPPGSPIPGILQARTLEWVAISFSKA